jgi:hypothetical protein
VCHDNPVSINVYDAIGEVTVGLTVRSRAPLTSDPIDGCQEAELILISNQKKKRRSAFTPFSILLFFGLAVLLKIRELDATNQRKRS